LTADSSSSRTEGLTPIDSAFTWKLGKQSFRTSGAWAEVRVKLDPRKGDQYCDVLVGVRTEGGSEPHTHIGINRDGSLRFVLPRERLHTIHRLVEDSNLGVVDNRGISLKPGLGKYKLILKLRVSEPERTVWVDFEETELIEQP
jgi:hypothetical protein